MPFHQQVLVKTWFQKQSSGGVLLKNILKNFTKFTWKHQCQSLFATLLKKALAQVLSCEFCEIFKNIFISRTPPVSAPICSDLFLYVLFMMNIFSVFSRSSFLYIFDKSSLTKHYFLYLTATILYIRNYNKSSQNKKHRNSFTSFMFTTSFDFFNNRNSIR